MACREIQIVSEFIHAKLQDALTMYVVLQALRKSTEKELKKLINKLKDEAVDSSDEDFESVITIYEKLIEKFKNWKDIPPSEEAYIKQSVQCVVEVVFCDDERLTHDW